MDTTLRYVQQFGRSKKDNLKPSLTNKYHVGQSIEVFPFRMMDFGCFASTADGLSGLLHNSEMAINLQGKLPELIDREASIQVRITKYDRRSGEVAFTMEGKEKDREKDKEAASPTPTVADAIALPELIAPTPATANTPATVSTPVPTFAQTGASVQPAVPVQASPSGQTVSPAPVVSTSAPATSVASVSSANTTSDLAPHQFTTSQPVPTEPTRDSLSVRLDQELADIQKFLEGVTQKQMSEKAQRLLRDLLEQNSTFRLTYAMQTVVDDFDPDLNFLLISLIEKAMKNPTP
ncbi:hypothetical protein [Tumebacillus permanentifrigoris]|uniref:S1 motif domain-containing protein n=1 Tax=Tumebacillus permanentifrigoris TaxID=378543 RepID=A0A316D744_9BACL|nr:hypothetical protein [Tumebacillus permanentifrigoris]PWK11276.1 hypothetical protein C7459_11170 [Tumebacillus permanentifrigoris]